ncbi:MAG: histone H1 [Flavobacterium sp.]|nr:MAG: histone H1 [Flavobacterium sp.]
MLHLIRVRVSAEATEKDAESFYIKKNKAAGTQLRKAYLEIKNLPAAGRNEVQDLKNEK